MTCLFDTKEEKNLPIIICQNRHLTKLEGYPKEAKNFNCSDNKLTSLEGCPKKIDGAFFCSENQLTSLKGGPDYVSGIFICSNNQLKSLEGAPQEVGGDFDCSSNQLTSLKGCPQKINERNEALDSELSLGELIMDFDCSHNQLTSLKWCPQILREFSCFDNQLTSLEGGPKKVKEFLCGRNLLVNLKGCPKEIEGGFYCPYNPNLEDISDLPSSCMSISIEGCPKIKKFPPKIDDELDFWKPTGWVRWRIKKVPFYEIVWENEDSITVRQKMIGPQLLDNL